MTIALFTVALALLVLAWCAARLTNAIERQASRVETHGEQLVKFGRAVYGSSGTTGATAARTVADPDAAERLARSDKARKSGPGAE